MQWSDLFSAFALMLILEGMLPFLKPEISRNFAKKLEVLSDLHLRAGGFALMFIGIILLVIVR